MENERELQLIRAASQIFFFFFVFLFSRFFARGRARALWESSEGKSVYEIFFSRYAPRARA
jgi:hypothetical protein